MPAEHSSVGPFQRLLATPAAAAMHRTVRKRPWLLLPLLALAALLYVKFAMAATFTVTTTADTSGSSCGATCSLRQAIGAANGAGVGPHTININIPGCGSGCTITLTGNLTDVTRAVIINGTAQAGFSGVPLVRINGNGQECIELKSGANGSTIRGLVLGNCKIAAIEIDGGNNNSIVGNYIGTNLAGNAADGNERGVYVKNGTGNVIGGTTAANRNVISGNTNAGVELVDDSNTVVGNYIGVGANGSTPLGNGNSGIWLKSGASSNRIGGVNAADANVIAHNTNDGVTFDSSNSSGNSILRNSIHSNSLRGIDFDDDGVTLNDTGDGDNGPNGRQNFPIVSSAVTTGASTTITGSINTNANTTLRLEFFSSAVADGSGYGEGEVYLGSTTVITNGSGNATYSQVLAVGPTAGHVVSATATVDLGGGNFGSTSEFSANATVTLAPAGYTVSAISGNTTEAGGTATFTVVLRRIPTANVTVPVSSSNTIEGTVSTAALVFTAANWATPQTVTITGQPDNIVDGNRAYTIVLGNATSADSGYNGLAPGSVAVTNIDIDTQNTIVVDTTSDTVDGNTSSLYALLSSKGIDGRISLREAIIAANNTANGTAPDRISFAIPLGAVGFTGTNGVDGRWLITLASALPALVDAVTIDGTTQTTAIANSNPGFLGAGGTVGVDALTLSQVARPEIEIVGTSAMAMAFDVAANNVTIRGFAIRGLGSTGNDAAIYIGNNFTGTLIEQNVLGSGATAFTDPGSAARNYRGIAVFGADSGTIRNNLIGFSKVSGVDFANNSAGYLVQNNEIRDTALESAGADGIGIALTTALTLQGNLITGAASQGLAMSTSSGITVVNNTLTRNGIGPIGGPPTQTQAIVARGTASNSNIDRNIITANYGTGVAVNNGATGIRITQNSIFDNGNILSRNGSAATGQIGIDLNSSTDNADFGTAPFFTLNDNLDPDSGGNNLQNFPVLSTAVASAAGTVITINGSLNSLASTQFRVEFFASTTGHASGYGGGQRYLGFQDVTTNGAGNATISVALSSSVSVGERISATATKSNAGFTVFTDTSEFSLHISVTGSGFPITGRLFEDINYGGGAGRSLVASGGVALVGARVELYDSGGVFIAGTTTAADGSYSLGTVSPGNHLVRVATQTVASTRSGSTGSLRGVMTWRTNASTGTAVAVTDRVGGTTPSLADPGSGSAGATLNMTSYVFSAVLSGTAHAVAPVTMGGVPITGVDFGFNFNTVVNRNDSGQGSLRQAITNANTLGGDAGLAVAGRTAGIEHVIFMLADGTTRPGMANTVPTQFAAGIAVISPSSAYPSITSPLVIDAQTQPGWVQDPIIELRGNAAGAASGLALNASSITVRGLIINRYSQSGIQVTGGNAHTIQGCWVGVDATGAAAAANTLSGVSVSVASNGLQIGGTSPAQRNVLSGNGSHGLYIFGGSAAVVQGNHVGLNALGTSSVGNAGRGVFLDTATTSATLGGTAAGAGNVVSGNTGSGIWLAGGATLVQGNFVGSNAAGSAARPNGQGLWAASAGHQIGGTTTAARNLIAGNSASGVWLDAGSNTLQGNYIGTNAAGTAALPNTDGIYVKGPDNVIGGSAAGAGNLVSGNASVGMMMDALASGSTVQGNIIGRNASQSAALPNLVGIRIGCSSGCAIGGTTAGTGNVISGNTTTGVMVGTSSQGNALLGNSIYGNTGIGIDLNGNGVSLNDGAMTPGAGNQLMDHPVFTSARARGNQLFVTGYVGSAADQSVFGNARVEVFTSDQDSSGYGEGQTYLGFVTTDASGNFSATITITQSRLAVGTRLTATATDSANNTSEFGANFAGLVVDLVVNHNGDAADASPGNGVCETATANQCTLRAALAEVNALGVQPGAITISFDLPGCNAAGQAACIITPVTALPAATQAVIIDGQTQAGWSSAPLVELVGSSAPAGTTGLAVNAAGSSVRGLVVGGFNKAGISINASNVFIQGNVIGLQGNGSTARGNGNGGASAGGIWVVGGTGVVVGGNSPEDRNVLSGNLSSGIWLGGGTVLMSGNYIGTNAAGTAAAGNGLWGVYAAAGTGHVIGGAGVGDGNLISGNTVAATGGLLALVPVTVWGNLIGTNAAGTAYVPNGDGISTYAAGIDLRSGNGQIIGGTADGEANTIAGNQGHGIRVATQTSRISGNRIVGNLWRGIDLNGDDVTANDGSTSGAQPNNGMDHPVFTGVGVAGDGLSITVMGFIGTGSGQAVFAGASVEVFKAVNDGSGYGQGQTYLGSLTADSNGRFSGTLAISFGDAVVGDLMTATATDASGNTSEFGPNWTSTTISGLAPASFNAFETDTAAGALTGVLRSKVAGSAATIAVLALDSGGTAPHPGFSGTVQLRWLDARDNSGAISGSCRASWLDLGAAASATFSSENRVNVSVTAPATGTRDMRLQISYVGPTSTVVACSNDNFAALPAQLSWVGASDTHSALAGTVRTLNNVAASGGVVHNAGRPFTLRAQALSALGAVMTAYDGTPALAISSCVLPVSCTAGALGGSAATAVAGVYRNDTVTYAEVGAMAVQLTDTGYASVDAADTTLLARTISSSNLQVGRFVPDSYTMTLSTTGVLATANAACLAAGTGATFMGQGFGWATAPQVTVTARNASLGTTTLWAGSLMKLVAGPSLAPTLGVAGAGTATLAPSYGAITLVELGSGQVRLSANALDRFVLDVPAGAPQATVTPTWQWQLNISDNSETGVSGNGAPASVLTQTGLLFDQGGQFHSGRLSLSAAHGDARSGVRMLMALQRYTPAGWVTMTEDRGCVTVQRAHLELSGPSGAFSTNLCAAPLAASATTAGGRAWLAMPATPGGAPGRVTVRVAGTTASGSACSPTATVQAVAPIGLPWLTGGATGGGPMAQATWGLPSRDWVLRRETW